MKKEITLTEANKLLNKKGHPFKVPKTCFNPAGTQRVSLRKAITITLEKYKLKTSIMEEDYPELVRDLLLYKDNIRGICKEINEKFQFDPSNKTRYAFSTFIEGLYEYGWNFMSDKKTETYLNKRLIIERKKVEKFNDFISQ